MSASDFLSTFYEWLGKRAILLPLPLGEKNPGANGWKEWQRTSFERTQEPDYQEKLKAAGERGGNIGVLLGGGLATIDIDDDQLVDVFLALNPALAQTLRSRGARGCQLWMRIKGDYPQEKRDIKKADGTKFCEWRGANCQSIIAGHHPNGTPNQPIRYVRQVAKPALEIAFRDIVWPADVILPWKDKEPQGKGTRAPELDKRIQGYVAAIPGAIAGQKGHDQTFSVACSLVNGWALTVTEAMPYLQLYNERCQPPWNGKELAHKLADAEKVQHDKPRGYLRGSPDGGNNEQSQPPVQPTTAEIVKTLGMFYDSNRTAFWVKNDRGGWMMVTTGDVRRRLKEAGFRSGKFDWERVSQVDSVLTAIQQSNDVDYADSLAGFNSGVYLIKGKRILVRDSPALIRPVKGDHPLLNGIFARMFDADQLIFFLGWLKIAVEALYSSQPRVGQALVLAGPPDCGKSLTQYLITLMFGGRPGKPHRYMAGLTPFNADLIGCEHLVIEDEEASTDIRARRNFGSKIKEICANADQSAHAKFRSAITLTPFWRLSISVNSEPENLMILPPIDEHLQDKFIILKAERHPMPMPTVTNQEREDFINALRAELSHFLAYLLQWQIPENLKSGRYGIAHFHHPDILEAITTMAPETRLLELLDAALFDSPAPGVWEGSANQLERKLTGSASEVKREAERLLTFPSACGTYLGRLQKRDPERFESKHTKKGNIWTINPP